MTNEISELKFPVAVNIEGVTEDQYNKIYDILLQVGYTAESKDFNLYVTQYGLKHIGVTGLRNIIHDDHTPPYVYYTGDSLSVYTAEEFLAKFSDNKTSLEKSYKNVRKRPNMQRSSSKCVVYYTDGSSYTINNFQEIIETDVTVIIGYIAPERKVMVERGVLVTEPSSYKNVEIDKEHLAGVVIKQKNGEDRVIRYSHLFASKQYVANQKNKVKAWGKRMEKDVERDNTNVDVPVPKDVQPTGYKLADGTYSSQYKVGDKFVVVDDKSYAFTKDSIVSLYFDNGTSTPKFKLEDGVCDCALCDGEAGAYLSWSKIEAYK